MFGRIVYFMHLAVAVFFPVALFFLFLFIYLVIFILTRTVLLPVSESELLGLNFLEHIIRTCFLSFPGHSTSWFWASTSCVAAVVPRMISLPVPESVHFPLLLWFLECFLLPGQHFSTDQDFHYYKNRMEQRTISSMGCL